MRQSFLFTQTKKEIPADELSKNAMLLIKAGYIHKQMSGVYGYLPLGKKVLDRIMNIIREEMLRVGSQEVSMTTLQEKSLWDKTGRWSDEVIDVWFKTKLQNGTELGLGVTHEEVMADMMVPFVRSYRDLPRSVFQFQTKFRNETRAKSGIMRTREFIMKDAYTFALDESGHNEMYEQLMQSYKKIFERVGLGDFTKLTYASGGMFSRYSHEYQTICEAGEDEIYIHTKSDLVLNKEVFNDEELLKFNVDRADFEVKKASEIGNIFNLGTKYSDAIGLHYADVNGEKHPVYMGSYGIGPARVMGVICELFADEKGLCWPAAVAPYHVHLVCLNSDYDLVRIEADNLYESLRQNGIDVLYDDRTEKSTGEKLADADLLGMPWRVIVSKKSLQNGGIELKERKSAFGEIFSTSMLLQTFKKQCD